LSDAAAALPPRLRDAAPAAAGARLGSSSLLALAAFGLLLFGLALVPRWLSREAYVTADEDNWMRRAGGFAWGVANGRLGRTYQNGHPGVLTMELAILGQGPGGAERFADPVTGNPRLVSALPGFFDGLVSARRAFALATAALVAAFGLAAVRLLGPGPAAAGAALLLADPFFTAHSQLVHLDALLAGLLALAVLCSLVRWGAAGGPGWLVAAGVLTGLALLAKAPAVFLLAWVPLLALALSGRRAWRTVGRDLLVWGGLALASFVLFWPSMWVNPAGTVSRMLEFALETGGQPHEQGSFFLGRPVVDPGPLFYPLALLLRSTPAALLGLALLALLGWRERRRLPAGHGRLLLALLASGLAFVAFMSLGAKKFDRYALPAVPLINLAAGYGFVLLAAVLARRAGPLRAASRRWAALGLLGVAGLLAGWPMAVSHPHYLAYFNPLLGGGATAARLIPVGEGEGLREVGLWLNQQPGAEALRVVSHGYDVLKATYVGGGEPLRDRVPAAADFVVLYNYQTQIGHASGVVAEYRALEPVYVVTLQGLEYAWVYRGPRSRA
jgi:4-amino-4-deoxy-L-arabinose transferase-like glycosyltransferase